MPLGVSGLGLLDVAWDTEAVMFFGSIPSPTFNGFEIGFLDIRMYGIIIASGVALAAIITRRRYQAFGGDPALAERVALWAVVIGFLGARLAYASTHLHTFEGRPWAIFAIWEGGLALYGGLTFGAITGIYLLRRWGGDLPAFADSVAIGIPVAQALGRWGNYFNQELFGTPTDLPWGLEIAPGSRPDAYATAETFHPTFLYESLANLALVFLMLWLERRRIIRRAGSLFGVYLMGYGAIRFLTELIRTDTVWRDPLLGLSRNGLVSLAAIIIGFIWIWRRERSERDREEGVSEALGV
ncbi:MAG: prolipoprotein diacylglyceryl transferase [Acidimicrobiia bacterium]|nr:prolipoprotein diacylglyceryl transferase [Acidimicrobiia bacterium]